MHNGDPGCCSHVTHRRAPPSRTRPPPPPHGMLTGGEGLGRAPLCPSPRPGRSSVCRKGARKPGPWVAPGASGRREAMAGGHRPGRSPCPGVEGSTRDPRTGSAHSRLTVSRTGGSPQGLTTCVVGLVWASPRITWLLGEGGVSRPTRAPPCERACTRVSAHAHSRTVMEAEVRTSTLQGTLRGRQFCHCAMNTQASVDLFQSFRCWSGRPSSHTGAGPCGLGTGFSPTER